MKELGLDLLYTTVMLSDMCERQFILEIPYTIPSNKYIL